jgi:hypothetical protein
MKSKNNNVFEVHSYVESLIGKEGIERYEEDYGLNGLDYLWSLNSKEEVDEVFKTLKRESKNNQR